MKKTVPGSIGKSFLLMGLAVLVFMAFAAYSVHTGSERDARVCLLMGLALGAMSLGFMAVWVHVIRNNVKTMGVIAAQNANLEKRVVECTAQLTQKTNDIHAMLQNMKLGVSTVIAGNRIHPE